MISDEELKAMREPKPVTPSWVDEPATPPQIGYIKGLIEDRDVPKIVLLQVKQRVEAGLTKGKAGEIINALKKLPITRKEGEDRSKAPKLADIPAGRYAVQTGPDENDLTFYRVVERSDQNDKTRKYKLMFVIAGPNEHKIMYGNPTKEAVKRIVRAGIGDSAVLYGRKVKRCSQCNIRITNRLSRELGIGPVCGGRVYEDWDSRVTAARSSLRAQGLDPNENVGE